MPADKLGDFKPSTSEVTKSVDKKLGVKPESKGFKEIVGNLKDRVFGIFASRDNKKPSETFQQLASQEIPGDQLSLSQEQKEKPIESDDDTISIFNTDYSQKIKDFDEAQRLSQEIKSEATKDSEDQPVTENLFSDRPSLYDQYNQQYNHERKSLSGAINHFSNIRRLQKEGLTKSDAREIYDNLRSRGVPDYQIKKPQEDFFGNLYRNEPTKDKEIITLLKFSPKIIDRLNSIGLMEYPSEFNAQYLIGSILTLSDTQFQEKKQQIDPLFFIDRRGIIDVMSKNPFDKEVTSFINYFKSEFLTQRNQKIDFSLFSKDVLELLNESVGGQQKIISSLTQKLIISNVNQDSTIKIHESLIPQEKKNQSTNENRLFLALSKVPGRAEQKYLINIYQNLKENKISLAGYDRLVKDDGTITVEFIKHFASSREKISSNTPIKSTLFELVTISDSTDFNNLKSLLSIPEIFDSFSSEDQKFWTKILTVGSTPYLNFLIRNKNIVNSLVDQNNKPTLELLFKLIEEKSEFSAFSSVCTPELVDKVPDFHPDKLFFTLISKIDSETIYDFLTKNKNSIQQRINNSSNPKEVLTQYLTIIEQINSSPSKEIIKIKDQLLIEILNNPKPLEAYQKISDIFIKNNLPLVGKIYRVFDVLYPPEIVKEKLSNPKLSRVLINKHSPHLRQSIIFNDLLKANLESGESSLVNYLNLLNQSSAILDKAQTGGPLSTIENKQLSFFFKKLDTLYDSSLLSRIQSTETLDTSTLQSKISELYQKYRVKDGQSISDRVVEMYFYNIGIKTLSEALNYINKSKENAHNRNLNQTSFSISPGDLIKNIKSENISSILNFGSVAKEYLGADAGSDATPFDTDTMRSNSEYSIENYQQVAASDYGDIYIVVKNRNQFQNTTDNPNPEYDIKKLEIFQSGVVNANHYGVRTGFPSSEIDFIITPSNETQKLENMFYEIAKHGVYIPVLNKDGNQIFTPQDYEKYRHSFDGVKQFGGDQIQIETSTPDSHFNNDIVSIKNEISQNVSSEVSLVDNQIKTRIKSILESLDIPLKDEFDTSILGCRLFNIGSSGRHTNLPNDFDFDYNLILDSPSYGKLEQLKQQIISAFSHQGEIPSAESSQIRLSGVTDFGSNPIDFDIGLNNTASTLVFASHEAIEQKLNSIRENYGESTYQEVIANIILAKKILKENHAYKKGNIQDGGFGGIGTENWILANNGSIKKAFETFWQAAHDGNRKLTLDEFRKKYFILDPGENLRDTGRNHDNFIFTLTETGYESMLKAIAKYQT